MKLLKGRTNVSSLADELLLEIFEVIKSLYLKEARELLIKGGQPWRYRRVGRFLDEKQWVPLVTHVCQTAIAGEKSLFRPPNSGVIFTLRPQTTLGPGRCSKGRRRPLLLQRWAEMLSTKMENPASWLRSCKKIWQDARASRFYSMDQAGIGRILAKDSDYANLKYLRIASHESLSPDTSNGFSFADFPFVQLQKLALYKVELAPSARFLGNLTHVYLHSIPGLTAPLLLNLLSKMPLLEVLDANHIRDSNSADKSDDMPRLTSPVTLKFIRLFSLETDLIGLPIILSNIILPEAAKREISFYHPHFAHEYVNGQPQDFTDVLGPLREKLTPRAQGNQSQNGNHILSLRLVKEDDRRPSGMFHAFTNALTPIDMLDSQPWAILRLDELESYMFYTVTLPFFNLLPLRNLVTLQVIDFRLDSIQWNHLFADLPALETIFILKDMFESADWHADLFPEVRKRLTKLILRREERDAPIEEMTFSDDNESYIFEDYIYGLPSFGVEITILPKLDTNKAIFCRLSNEFEEVEADFYEIEEAQDID